ncbi:PhzF family phenazine biosynthesis protein [Novosphingobium sp. YJ-S2-02]|uniref:PhzF family phenazine biosynthesis protein n=1 Tax=Novosphingobium aureum TaxID=2792964 RepID=A0A931HBF9_9SPHN|nr:PhzF family phenazine biosynthesis protein [Novosphingobium aureum]MBH0112394.1 PhzF family phenazine biosynthesis protein [Novosphingobium aureum]
MYLDLVDVFATGSLTGNPLAVVRSGEALDGAAMQKLTRWLGFSETAFLLPPQDPAADYRVRIFYPAGELPFAGHPTLGSAHAWLGAGGVPRRQGRIMQECGIGLVEIRQEDGLLGFMAPPLRRSEALDAADLEEAVRLTGVEPAVVVAAVHADNGPGWKLLHLASAHDVLSAESAARGKVPTDVALLGPYLSGEGGQARWEVRAFFADANGRLCEDPVTGSLNAAVAQYLFAAGLEHDQYFAAQGRMVGASGMVCCSRDSQGQIWVKGLVRTVSSGGVLTLPGSVVCG